MQLRCLLREFAIHWLSLDDRACCEQTGMAESLPSTSTLSSADIQDCGSNSDSDELTPDSGSKPLVQTFLSQLRAPGRSTLARKCTVLQNFGPVARKKKPSCSTDPSSVTLYLAKASSVTVSPEFDTLMWWQNHASELPNWSEAVKDLVLVQPSSAAADLGYNCLITYQ